MCKIEITWPSGTKQLVENPRLREILRITETKNSAAE